MPAPPGFCAGTGGMLYTMVATATHTNGPGERTAEYAGRYKAESNDMRFAPPATARSMGQEPTEHEARGLLNLVALLSHCLLKTGATDDEKFQWRREVNEAKHRLQQLQELGLRRAFW